MTYIHVDLDNFDTDDLVEELELRGLKVIDNDDSGAMSEVAKDEIYNLYREYVAGNNFDKSLKKFFEENLGIVVV